MPVLLATRSTPPGLITLSDLQQVLSDALLAFSPFALLVGTDSTRALAQKCTNAKQVFMTSIAPIGTLGMMATICKGSNLLGLKEMLGVEDGDINDAACELGCGVLFGLAVPRMSKGGGLTSAQQDANRGTAACAIVRLEWKTGQKCLDFAALRGVVETFSGGTMSGRLVWDVGSQADMLKKVEEVRAAMLSSYNHHSWDNTLFDALDADHLKGGEGMVELHWPAPAMPLETNSLVIYLFGGVLIAGFLTIGGLAASTVLSWQSYPSVVLLLGGQLILALGQVAAQYVVKYQRITRHVKIPRTGLGKEWFLVDNTWFTSCLARWAYSFQPLSPHHISLGQHHSFKQSYVSTWHALLTLTTLAFGFIAFYVGGKSSNIRTVLVYIGLFFIANITKGRVLQRANKPYFTFLNNFGYIDIVTRRDKGKQSKTGKIAKVNEIGDDEKRHNEGAVLPPNSDLPRISPVINAEPTRPSLEAQAHSLQVEPALIPLTTDTNASSHRQSPSGPTVTTAYRIYAKFALRDIDAIGMFYFSSAQEWAMAAHAIHRVVKPRVRQWGVLLDREPFLEMPVLFTDDDGPLGRLFVHSLILIAIDETRHEDTFWSAGMEVTSVLMSNFTDVQNICSESPKATLFPYLAGFVRSCIWMMLAPEGSSNGVQSLMRSIDLIRAKYPHDESRLFARELVDVAQYAAAHTSPPMESGF